MRKTFGLVLTVFAVVSSLFAQETTAGFQGSVKDIEQAWTALLQDWLPSSGLRLDARPCFEHYPRGSSYDPQTGVFSCEICIPVIPL